MASAPTPADFNRAPMEQAAADGFELTVVVPTFNERANVERLVGKLQACLAGVAWQAIFVDDNSPDGTAAAVKALAARDPRLQCLRRVGRRGLAGAVVEGILASAAPYVAVIDGDLQHDETLLPQMLARLRAGEADLVIASRYAGEGASDQGLDSGLRRAGSNFANRLGRAVLRQDVSDPVSGFFMARREVVEQVAPKLAVEGFKILFDLIASQPAPLRIIELPYAFREREAGGSKLDKRIVIDYLGLLLSKVSQGVIPTRALLFFMVGASGVVVHLCVLQAVLSLGRVEFWAAQLIAASVSMTSNYLVNNEVTYRDRRRHGLGLLVGYLQFCGLCGVGFFANLSVAAILHRWGAPGLAAGGAGALFGAVWNYLSTALAVW